MTTIVTRQTGPSAKGSPLTNTELDNNFINLNTGKLEVSGGTITGDLTIQGHANVQQHIAVGTGAYVILPNLIAQFTGTSDYYSQVNQQNLSANGTGDFVVTADNGTDLINYLDLGLAGNTYNNQTFNAWSFVNPNDGYLMMQGNPSQEYGANLFIGTAGSGSTNKTGDIVFIQGDAQTEVGRWKLGQGFRVSTQTASTSNTTGAIVVDGGVGVKGNVVADNVFAGTINLKSYVDSANAFLQSESVSKTGDTMSGGLYISNTGGTALDVTGNVIIRNDMYVTGNLIVTGNVTEISANTLSVNDPIIYLANNNPANLVDIGFVGPIVKDYYQHTGIIKDHTDGKWKFFSNVVSEPYTTVDFSQAIFDVVKVGTIEAATANIANVNLLSYATMAFSKANGAYDRANTAGIVNSVSGTTSRITATGTTDVTIDLDTIPGLVAGTYSYPQLQIDSFGRTVSISNQTPVTSLSNTAPITVNQSTGAVTVGMATSGVTAKTYGDVANVPTITVDQYGRVTAVTNTAIVTGATISDDTTNNSSYYPLFTTTNTGTLTTVKVSSSKLNYNPSTGTLTTTTFSGAGTGLTGTASGLTANISSYSATTNATTGTLYPQLGLGTSGNYVTYANSALSFNAATGVLTATSFSGVGTGLTGTASGLTANVANYESVTTATTGTYYPQLALGVSGTYASYANTSLSFNAATGALTATSFSGAGTGLTGTAANLTANVASYETVTNATTGIYYPQMALGTSGTYASYSNTAISFNAATGQLSTLSANITSTTASTTNTTGALVVTGGVGVRDSLYVGNRVGFANTTQSFVYQVYNATLNSLDTIFG